jgi:hypothetical protein
MALIARQRRKPSGEVQIGDEPAIVTADPRWSGGVQHGGDLQD